MQNQSYDHSYAEEAYEYDAESDAQSDRSRDENPRERDHHRNDGDRERDGQRAKSREENYRDRNHQQNEISNSKSKLIPKDKSHAVLPPLVHVRATVPAADQTNSPVSARSAVLFKYSAAVDSSTRPRTVVEALAKVA